VPFEAVFKAFKAGGYQGWYVIEAFGRALPDLAAATRVWRDFFPSREEVYRAGHDFLRETWAKA
jgi:D-psicose/D-tagatose/L-ribulose 3-epimerase